MSVAVDLTSRVEAAVAAVDDPEYPGVSIVDLGLVERVDVRPDASVDIELIPTFAGCPALDMIAGDVRRSVGAVVGVGSVEVRWVRTPVWSTERLTARGHDALRREFTVAVELGSRRAVCPRCGTATIEQSMFGPSRCRSVHRCPGCDETVEVMRS